jgi:hypothetical protein
VVIQPPNRLFRNSVLCLGIKLSVTGVIRQMNVVLSIGWGRVNLAAHYAADDTEHDRRGDCI